MLKNQLHLKLAPMCGGKTDYLLTEMSRFLVKYKCLYINHLQDTRSENSFSTHSTLQKTLPINSNFKAVKTSDFKTFSSGSIDPNDYDAIFIDEGNFYGPELITFVKHLVDDLEKYVVVAGLDGDFNREKFGYVLDLIPLCDSVKKLFAVCEKCGNKAIFSHRTVDSTEKVLVGGKELYQPLCRKCYLFHQKYKITTVLKVKVNLAESLPFELEGPI